LHFRANPGDTQCQLHIDGGVSILLPHPEPEIGNATSGIKLTSLKWHDHQLQIEADVNAAANNTSRIHTPWKIATIEGATAHPSPDDTYAIDPTTTPGNEHSYRRVKMTITFNQQ
jgi:hypothetical protein